MKRTIPCLLVCLALLCAGCTQEAPSAEPAQTTAVPTEAVTEPTSAPTTEPPLVWDDNIHSGIREDGTFDEGTVFIGDSLTFGLLCQYLMPERLIGDAWFMAKVGAPLNAFFLDSWLMEEEDSVFSAQFWEKSYMESVALVGEKATAIYVMLGTNYDYYNNSDRYIEMVDFLLETCPNATVYLQLIPCSTSEHVHTDEVNGAILTAHSHYAEQGIQRVMVIDTYAAIGENLLDDGIHLDGEGQRLWYEAILRFAEENRIPQ